MTNAANKASTKVNLEKAVIVNNAAPAVAVTITKADKAREVFAKAYPDGKTTTMQRKDIINLMISEAGLTKPGAATYLQNFKKKAGIVQERTAPTAVAA